MFAPRVSRVYRVPRYEFLVTSSSAQDTHRDKGKWAMGVGDVRRWSSQLLGNIYRLEVVEAINRADGEPVTATSVHEETGIKYPRVQEELKRLTEAGLLMQKDAPRGQPVEYKAVSTVYWKMCERLLAEVRSISD